LAVYKAGSKFTAIFSPPDWLGRPMLNLDTHMVVYAFMGTITARERRILTGDSCALSALQVV
jgi:hypothetical protein